MYIEISDLYKKQTYIPLTLYTKYFINTTELLWFGFISV